MDRAEKKQSDNVCTSLTIYLSARTPRAHRDSAETVMNPCHYLPSSEQMMRSIESKYTLTTGPAEEQADGRVEQTEGRVDSFIQTNKRAGHEAIAMLHRT